jgi:diguanylate cyclase (GGDEF)-like protein
MDGSAEKSMRIRNFIFAASALVAVLFFGGTYFALGNIFDNIVKANAARTSEAAAKVTFASMYQLMSRGWSRSQADAFLRATAESGEGTGLKVQIYRGQLVVDIYREIAQPPLDLELKAVFATGQEVRRDTAEYSRHIYPLVAEDRCLTCHHNAKVGDVLGAVEVRQDFAGLLSDARRDLLIAFAILLPLALLLAGGLVWWVGRRIEHSVEDLQESFEAVNGVSDLRNIQISKHDLGFAELNGVVDALNGLVEKLRGIAVDKEVLKFEIGLLEKFVITSEVVRDWREYVGRLLGDINTIMPTHVLFSIFKIDDEVFDLEIFWRGPPNLKTRVMMEGYIRQELNRLPVFSDVTECSIHHHVSDAKAPEIRLTESEVAVRVKSFFVDLPKIGGIVGIGVHAGVIDDETRFLVMESVLSTLLNVVGSVKAIYKYTRDLEYYATRDPLTDLFNQRVFWELASYEVGRAHRHDYKFGLLLIDLDNFKLINDNYGHTIGDRYLQRFARQVQEALREGDILARYGGDEFVALLPEADAEAVAMVAERVRMAVESMVVEAENGERLRGTASIGLAVFPDHAANPKDLLLFADNMMYKAKAGGKGQVAVPTPEDVVDVFRGITQKSVMVLEALEAKRIVPFFQPILDVANRRIAAYEVLSRIELDGEVIRADEFVEIAEKMGVIHRMDTLVMEQALNTLAAMKHEGLVFVNLSPRALVFNEFARDIRRIVADSGFPPERVVFEITERDTVKNLSLLERFLNDLKADGFKLAIDDFGSGFSSFHYLRRFPIDFLKIEGDFIANMLDSEKDHTFVTSIRSLAREMGITVVAEYVESAEVLNELERMEVHLAQGYFVGKPQRELVPLEWHPTA